jgi:hypothetical protein
MGNSSKTSEVSQINQSMSNITNMSLPQLQNLAGQIGGILKKGRIKTDVTYKNYEKKYRVTTRNGVEISREYIETNYVGTSSSIKEMPLSSDNKNSLNGALSAVNLMIEVRKAEIQINKNISSSVSTLNKIGNNPNSLTSIDKALDLSVKFLGPHEKTGNLSERSDSLLRLISKDGKRQVRWDIEPKNSHCKGKPHFNFEFLDDNYRKELSKKLGFEVSSNYHLFIDK